MFKCHPRLRIRELQDDKFLIGCPQNIIIINRPALSFLESFRIAKKESEIDLSLKKEFLFLLKMGFIVKC